MYNLVIENVYKATILLKLIFLANMTLNVFYFNFNFIIYIFRLGSFHSNNDSSPDSSNLLYYWILMYSVLAAYIYSHQIYCLFNSYNGFP